MSLMISISGIRGVVGETLTPEIVVKYASAFAAYCEYGKIVVGRDGRTTGKAISNIVTSTLLAAGCDVIVLGVAPTPTIGIAVEQLHAAGGISITASHNPIEWNGLKFICPSGMFLDEAENRKFWLIAESAGRHYARWDEMGRQLIDDSFLRQHIDMVLNLPYLDIRKIQRRKLKVAVDCINAAGGVIIPRLLEEMGCEVVPVNCDVRGVFARMPEPIPEHLVDFCRLVREQRADCGVVVDPDVDRLVMITEKGEPFGEEYTITTAVKFVLERTKTPEQKSRPVVVNLSTTRAVDDVASAAGVRVVRTPVGEINVAARMKEVGSLIGGEGSGGVILPAVHYGRDAVVGTGLILESLVDFGGTMSEFKRTLPQYSIVKSKVAIGDVPPADLLKSIADRHRDSAAINTDDGLKLDFERSWVHLRASNTEPVIRIIAEAPTREEASALVAQFQSHVQTS